MLFSSLPVPSPLPPEKPTPRPVRVPSPVEPRRPRRWRIAVLLLVVAALGGLLYWLLRPEQAQQFGSGQITPSAPVTPAAPGGPLVVRIAGQTSARNYAAVMVPMFRGLEGSRELIILKTAVPGSFLKKGDLAVEFDAQGALDHIDDVKDMVQSAENDVKKKQATQDVEWEALQQELRTGKADLDRAVLDLKAAEVKTEVEREILKLAADEAQAAYQQLLTDVQRKKVSHQADLRITEIAAKRQHSHLDRHVNDLKRYTVTAPIDGLAVMAQVWRQGQNRQMQEGDQVHPGQMVMRIVDLSNMQVEGWVSQTDARRLRVGKTATIGLDAFPGLTFTGKIVSMGALAVKGMWDTYYIRNVPVRISIQGSDPKLIPDLSAWAEVKLDALAGSSAK